MPGKNPNMEKQQFQSGHVPNGYKLQNDTEQPLKLSKVLLCDKVN